MKIHVHNKLQNPQVIEVTRVVVYDSKDNPIALAVETDDGIIIAETVNSNNVLEFNAILKSLGINKTVVVHDIKQKPLSEIYIPGS